jgi:hypothetical protein
MWNYFEFHSVRFQRPILRTSKQCSNVTWLRDDIYETGKVSIICSCLSQFLRATAVNLSNLHRLIILQHQRRQDDRSAYHMQQKRTAGNASILVGWRCNSLKKAHKTLSTEWWQCFAAAKPVRMERHIQKWPGKCQWPRMIRAPVNIDGQNTVTVACW